VYLIIKDWIISVKGGFQLNHGGQFNWWSIPSDNMYNLTLDKRFDLDKRQLIYGCGIVLHHC
jgi:hypothetical protein